MAATKLIVKIQPFHKKINKKWYAHAIGLAFKKVLGTYSRGSYGESDVKLHSSIPERFVEPLLQG